MRRLADSIPTYFVFDEDECVVIAFSAAEWRGRVIPPEFMAKMHAAVRTAEIVGFDLTPVIRVELERRVDAFLRQAATEGDTWRAGFTGRVQRREPQAVDDVEAASLN